MIQIWKKVLFQRLDELIWYPLGCFTFLFYPLLGNMVIGEWHSSTWYMHEAMAAGRMTDAMVFAAPIFLSLVAALATLTLPIRLLLDVKKEVL